MQTRRSWMMTMARAKWTLAASGGRVEAYYGGRLMTAFHHDHARWDKPFLYPLTTPAGRVISRGFPLEPRAGESNDHAWHRGLFYGHGLINGQDFWRETGREKTGTLKLVGAPVAGLRRGAPVLGGRFQLQPPKGEPIGVMTQQYRLEVNGSQLRIGFVARIEASRGQALRFGDTDDGGFGLRLSDEFRQDRGARLRNSEGQETTERIWGRPARWVQYATKEAGAVMFDHPGNPRHPGRWHARGYALCSANPFALRAFTKDKTQDGEWEIAAGQALELRYTVILHDGELDPARVK